MKSLKTLIKSEKLDQYLIIVFSLAVTLFVTPQLLFQNNMNTWDLSGHIFSSQFIRDFLLPFASGWNPFLSLGYSQGSFYPGTIHYTIAVLSLIYNDPAFWLKVLIIISILALPFSINYFLKSIAKVIEVEVQSLHIVIITIISSLLIFISPSYYPGSLNATLVTGLVTNFITFPLFFFYLGLLYRLYQSEIRIKLSIVIAVTLAVIMLSHLVLGFISVFTTMVLLVMKFLESSKSISGLKNNNYIYILTITFVPTSFFYIVYLLNNYLVSPILANVTFSKAIMMAGLGMILFSTIYAWKYLKNLSRFLSVIFVPAFCILLTIFDFVFLQYLSINLNLGIVQPYRLFSISLFVLFPIFLLVFILLINKIIYSEKLKDTVVFRYYSKNWLSLAMVFLLIIVGIFGIYRYVPGLKNSRAVEFTSEISKLKGNYLVLVTTKDTNSLYREVFYAPFKKNKNLFSLNTQFNESSYTNASIEALATNLYNYNYKQLKENIDFPETYILPRNQINLLLNLYNTKYLIFVDKDLLRPGFCENTRKVGKMIQSNPKDLYICDVVKTKPLAFKVYTSSNRDWNHKMEDLMHSEFNELLVNKDIGNANIDIYQNEITWAKNYQSFEAELTSEFTVMPVQYNNHWRAFDKDGKEIDVYRVSPNLIGIKNNGKVKLNYDNFKFY